MSTWEDIRNNEPLADPMRVTVEEATQPQDGHRSWTLTVRDASGKSFEIDIWTPHDPGITFREGHQYEVREAMGQVWNDGASRKLNSWSGLEVSHLGTASADPLRIFVFSDTHVGYRHRSAKRVKWWRQVDCLASFKAAIDRAIELDVDAVVHGGDIYDEHATKSEVIEVESKLSDLYYADIPFYYIRGNHESSIGDSSIELLQKDGVIRKLGQSPTTLERNGSELALYGTDYEAPENHPANVPTDYEPRDGRVNVLVLHQSFRPVYPKGKLDLDRLSPVVPSHFSYVFIGHMHNAMDGTYGSSHVQYTGATDHISKTNRQNNPSAWMLRVTGSEPELERLPITS